MHGGREGGVEASWCCSYMCLCPLPSWLPQPPLCWFAHCPKGLLHITCTQCKAQQETVAGRHTYMGWRPNTGEGERHDTAPAPQPRPGTPFLPKTHPMTPEVGGLPTMHATPCATLVGKGHREAEAQREKQQQGTLRGRSAGREGECQRRGAGQGCGDRGLCVPSEPVRSH